MSLTTAPQGVSGPAHRREGLKGHLDKYMSADLQIVGPEGRTTRYLGDQHIYAPLRLRLQYPPGFVFKTVLGGAHMDFLSLTDTRRSSKLDRHTAVVKIKPSGVFA